MQTCIDQYIEKFMCNLALQAQKVEDSMQILLDRVREAFDLDMVFLMENQDYVNAMVYTFSSVKQGVAENRFGELYLTEQNYKELLLMYDKEDISEKHLECIHDADDVLHYGLITNDYYYGCVGFRSIAHREWTDEERRAIGKLGRAIYFYFAERRLRIPQNERTLGSILNSSSVNVSDYLVDLKEDRCHAFKIYEGLKNKVPEWSKYSEYFEMICEKYIDVGFDTYIREKFSLESLRTNLSDENASINAEYRRTEENQKKWYRVVATLVDLDEQNQPYHVTLAIEDITDIIPEREKNFYAFKLLKRNFYRIFMIDIDNNKYSGISGLQDSLLEDRPEKGNYMDLVNAISNEKVYPADRTIFERKWSLEYLKGNFEQRNKIATVEYRRIVNGEYRWIRAEFIPNENYGNGNHSAIAYLRDISDEMAIREEHSRIINSLSNIYFGLYYIDCKKKTFQRLIAETKEKEAISENGDVNTLFQYLLENAVDKKYQNDILDFYNIEKITERIENKKIISCEYLDQEEQWCRANFIPVYANSAEQLKYVLLAVSQIGEEKKKELDTQLALRSAYIAATKANSAKTDFLSRMSHDIRTPMNAIIGMTEIAEKNLEDQIKVKDCLDKILTSSNHLLSLINEVLDMSKIESGTLNLKEAPVNIVELCHNLLVIMQPQINEHRHCVKIENGIVHKIVVGDDIRLQQIFLNVMSNAIKYTPDGGRIVMRITEQPSRQAQIGCYQFQFEDNGIGMSKEFIKHIFEPFTREEDSRTSKVQGTGLGMPIVQNIVRIMNGDIQVESEIGKGSKFTITLFLRQLENGVGTDSQKTVSQEKIEKSFVGKRILLVEDQEFNQQIAQEFLEMLEVKTECAENGLQALEMIKASKENYYDLVFMDIQMPIMNGYEATEQIRKLKREDIKKMPIIAMTANAFSEDVRNAKNAGMNEHIAKPISIKLLKRVLSDWL